MALLEVDDLHTYFYTDEGVVKASNGVSYCIQSGEKVAIVGESGAGKSVSSLSVMGLIDSPGRIVSGEIRFRSLGAVEEFAEAFPDRTADTTEGETPSEDDFVVIEGRQGNGITEGYVDLVRTPRNAMRRIRGNRISMIFQDPLTALNPVYTVGAQIIEAIQAHEDVNDRMARERTIELLDRVGIPDADERVDQFPHEFSGGMQQRAVIAMALSCDPELIIADEPTTALDVTIEAQILELLDDLTKDTNTSIQLITHDLGVVAGLCDRVMVMYAGKPVEKAPITDLYYDPKHPYTVGLMSSIPRIGATKEKLDTIPGTMPDLVQTPPGCSFHPRCPYAEEVCTQKEPPLMNVETGDPADDSRLEEHAASCLAYSGDLQGELTYEIIVQEKTQ